VSHLSFNPLTHLKSFDQDIGLYSAFISANFIIEPAGGALASSRKMNFWCRTLAES
jgi:hypothetical protein